MANKIAAAPGPEKPTAKSLVKPMGAIVNPNDPDPLQAVLDEENNRFVIVLFDGDCEILYEIEGQTITLLSINIPEIAQGQGIGKRLAKFAFTYAVENKLDVVVKCNFLATYYLIHRDCKKFRGLRVIGRYPQETIEANY